MSTQRYEIEAYLGHTVAQLTGDQIDQLVTISDDINGRYDEDSVERDAAMQAAVAYMLGGTNAHTAAREYRAAQLRRDETLAAAIQVASMAGLDQSASAKTIGINRRTVARHLGKLL